VRNSTDSLVFNNIALFRDRPLDESLRSSLELADYTDGLKRTGLLTILQRPGPYTVFAIPNQALEQAQNRRDRSLLDPAMQPWLKRTLSYTIIPGAYPDKTLRTLIAKTGGAIGLRSLDGDILTVSIEPSTNQLLLSDPTGQRNRIWLSSMPQSNGVLYATQSMLVPGQAVLR
jgi:uncharacterized surface protein with fasciclin (FAS1) repeats